MAIRIKYQSKNNTRTQSRVSSGITYYAEEAELKAWAAALHVGGTLPGLEGAITSIRTAQEDGDIWICEVVGEFQVDDGGNPSNPESSTGPNSQRLTGTRLNLPLEDHPKYRTRWNHVLFAREGVTETPAWWTDATDTALSSDIAKDYQWGEVGAPPPSGWYLLLPRDERFKGVSSWDKCLYTVTETAKHASKSQAGWVSAKLLNSIVSSPLLGDFGLTSKVGGNWKVEDVNVYYDGNFWLADRSYTLSGDSRGWNDVLYGDGEP